MGDKHSRPRLEHSEATIAGHTIDLGERSHPPLMYCGRLTPGVVAYGKGACLIIP